MNVSPSYSGIIKVNGTSAPSYPYTYTFASTTTVIIEAVGTQGRTFEYWAGCISGSVNPTSVTVNQTRSVTAFFSAVPTLASIGGFVWDDVDADGVQDDGEGGVDGEVVSLLLSDRTSVDSTTTVNGSFIFADLYPGSYYIYVMPSTGAVFSARDQGEDDTRDSDIKANGLTDVITIEAGEENVSLGAGIVSYTTHHTDLTPLEAKEIIDASSDMLVVDLREESEMCEAGGSIPCAINVPWFSGDFAESVSALDPDTPILLVCASGYRSTEAAELLSFLGFTSVYNMLGGMMQWPGETWDCEDLRLQSLYFPVVRGGSDWKTDICIINPSAHESLRGVLKGYNKFGEEISEPVCIFLPPHGRKEVTGGNIFNTPEDSAYSILESCNEAVGYIKLTKEGAGRAAVPAVSKIAAGDRFLSHIASNQKWETEITLLNTTTASREVTLAFNNGESKSIALPARGQATFTIASLFGGLRQPTINAGVLTDADGVIGVQLFQKEDQLFGILLEDSAGTTVYYPHTVTSERWATGIIAYSPASSPITATITAYSSQGIPLLSESVVIDTRTRFSGTISSWGLPSTTAWCAVESENSISGLEALFNTGTMQAAGINGLGKGSTEGILPSLEKNGWTGLAIVNVGSEAATVDLTAHNDRGEVVAMLEISLDGHAKVQGVAEKLFSLDVSGATYLRYSSDGEIVAIQTNGSSDGTMLDALPSL